MTYNQDLRATVVATSGYEKDAAKLLNGEERRALENSLAEAPEAHPVIPGAGGVRKARWGKGTKGKSGGVRAIYYYFVAGTTIYMLALYAKSRKPDLTEREKKGLKKLVRRLQ
jgi:hypothetical protein